MRTENPSPVPPAGENIRLGVEWESVRRGNPQAIEDVCENWLPTILQWCRRLAGPNIDAEQASQDVFLVVLRRVSTVQRPEQLPSWMFAVTRRVLAQHRRRAWVRRWIPGDVPEAIDHRPAPDAVSSSAETARAVQAILAQMPEDLRAVLVLCEVEERSDPEAADILGIKVGTAKSRLRRARALFRELYAQNHPDFELPA